MLGLRWNCSASPPSSRFALCFTKSSSSFALLPAPLRAFRAACWSQCSRSPNLVELEYADLNLKDFYGAGCVSSCYVYLFFLFPFSLFLPILCVCVYIYIISRYILEFGRRLAWTMKKRASCIVHTNIIFT